MPPSIFHGYDLTPHMFPHTNNSRLAGLFLWVSAIILLFVPVLVLFGWWADAAIFKSEIEGFPNMKPMTAIGFIFVGSAFVAFLARPFGAPSGFVFDCLAVLTVVVGLSGLGGYVNTFDWLATTGDHHVQNPAATLMSPHSAFIFLFFGASLFLLRRRKPRALQASAFLAIVGAAAAYVAILGHLYGANRLYGINQINGMALHTAALFMITSGALIAANAKCTVAKLLLADTAGGYAVRRLIPVVILVPTFIGWLRVLGQRADLFDTGFGSAMATLVIVILTCFIVVFYSRTAHRSDLERRRAEEELAEKENRYHDLFEYSQSILGTHDLDGNITSVNAAFIEAMGFANDELVGKPYSGLVDPQFRPHFDAYLRKVIHEGEDKGLVSMAAKNGRSLVWQYHNILVTEVGKDPYVLASALDVTHYLKLQKQLEMLSLTDEMTGLHNRRGFITLAEQQLRLEQHGSTARGLALMFADMDGLKKINDTLGHEAGSEALQALARIIKSVVRNGDLVARWGGDEFVVLSIGAHGDEAEMMAERIKTSLAEYNASGEKPYQLACSIGIAPVIGSDRSFDEIIAEADEAMYEEKKRRKAAREGHFNVPAQEHTNLMSESFAWY